MPETEVKQRSAPASAPADGQRGAPVIVTEPPKPGKKRIALFLALGVAVAGISYFAWNWWAGRQYASTDNAQVGGDVIPVLPHVNGYVSAVRVHENQLVNRGDTLLIIDDSELRQRVNQAEAELRAAEQAAGGSNNAGKAASEARAAVASAQAAQSAIAQATANAERAARDVERLRPLADEGIVSRQQFDGAVAAHEAAQAQLRGAQQNALAAEQTALAAQATVGTANNRVAAIRAALDQARLQLTYASIVSPISGIVARKNVQVGQLVGPGQALMTIVPLTDVWVTANLKETQLTGIQPGSHAEITVDAYPGRTFGGSVESIAPATGATFSLLPPENATGNFTKVVQRVPVRIRLDSANDQKLPLRPGMSVEVKIRKAG